MAQLSIMSVLSLCLLLPTALALPPFWPHGYREKAFPTLTISYTDGVHPTGVPGTTGTGTGTGTVYFPTATGTGTAYYTTATGTASIFKRDPDHPFGYPPPFKPSLSSGALPTGFPTASAPPILSTYIPTGTVPSASGTGTGFTFQTSIPNEQEVDAAKQAHREHFEGPRKQGLKPYYPYVPSQSDDGGAAAPSATAPTGATGTGVFPWPVPTGTTVVPLPAPTGSSVIPLPMPTGGSSSVVVPLPSGTGASDDRTASI